MTSALQKLRNQINKKEEKPMAKTTAKKKESVEQPIPSEAEILKMKVKELDDYHATLPEELDEWKDLKRDEKRETLAQALYGEEKEEREQNDLEKELSDKKGTVVKMGAQDSDSELAKTVNKIENLSEDEADEQVHVLKENIDFNYFKLGGVLAVIKANNYIGEFKNFREKVEADFGMKYRKADYLIKIYENLTESEVDWNKLSDIGWSKLKEISHLITPENVDEWVEKAKAMNVRSLIEEVKQLNKSGASVSTKKASSDISTMTFKFHEDQKVNVQDALEKAKEESDTDVNSVALEYICLEYLAGGKKRAVVKEATLEDTFKKLLKDNKGDEGEAISALLEDPSFEKVFGVKFADLVVEEE